MRKNVLKLMMTALLMAMAPCVNAQIEVGYILCEGDTLVSPSDFDSLNLAPLGVVFYVDNSGEHGCVVALQDDGLFSWVAMELIPNWITSPEEAAQPMTLMAIATRNPFLRRMRITLLSKPLTSRVAGICLLLVS